MQFPIAINIALIPEKAVYDRCVALSQQLAATQRSPYLLGPHGEPHITLLQGCVYSMPQLLQLIDALQAPAAKPAPLLHSRGLTSLPPSSSAWWALAPEGEVFAWHRRVMQAAMPLLFFRPTPAMFAGELPETRAAHDCNWVANYPAAASNERFSPHITLGYGHLDATNLPNSFYPNSLGIFQLGAYCSCLRPLHRWALRQG